MINRMLKPINITAASILCALASLGCSATVHADDIQRLLPDTCVPLASSKLTVTLAPEWQPYLSSTRVCPLARQRGAKPNIVLISVFAEDYYYQIRGKPDADAWADFPKSLLFNAEGKQVGEIERLFPGDNLGEVVLAYGHWQGSIPGEIRTHIISRTATGDRDLPTLLWNKEKQRYVEGDRRTMPASISTDDFQKLLPDACAPLASTRLKVPLPAEWKRYLSSTRVCPFVKRRGTEPDIVLISVSPDDYNRNKSAGSPIADFPEPLLVNHKGEQIGKLRESFLNEEVVEMILTYGHWQGNVPGEIRMYISNPTVTGNYNLPTLVWNKEEERYVESDKPVIPVMKSSPE